MKMPRQEKPEEYEIMPRQEKPEEYEIMPRPENRRNMK
jgi:hypothetical protein